MALTACKLNLNKTVLKILNRNFEILRHLLVRIETKSLEVDLGPKEPS